VKTSHLPAYAYNLYSLVDSISPPFCRTWHLRGCVSALIRSDMASAGDA